MEVNESSTTKLLFVWLMVIRITVFGSGNPTRLSKNPFFAGRNALEGTQQPAWRVRMRLELGHPLSGGCWNAPKVWIFPILCTGANIVHPLWILRAMGSGSCACERKGWQTPAQARRVGAWRLPVDRESDTGALQNLP